MNFDPVYLLYALIAYLLGSISTAIITCKIMGLADPRSVGSNNPGATNVLRTGGKKAAIITLFGDMLKGLLPVLVAQQMQAGNTALAITGISAFLGHLYPLYFGFKGGKGVATFYGVLLGINWIIGLAALAVWGAMALIFKISALSALVSAFSAPFIIWYIDGSAILIAATVLMSTLLILKHHSNIKRLLQGTEGKIASGDKTDKSKPE
ncbi:MAG: glycerol-3-phosphate 1-O-acyltransferase PlsY [Gammaproteobacteria bacterium]|nr:glycerol-3-phosphate 1-O-acyltransferase PlsY [Gammaproteobacteria bacterium]